MHEFDLYLNPERPMIGLYVRHGAGLPDLEDADAWLFDGTIGPGELSTTTLNELEASGHAFADLER